MKQISYILAIIALIVGRHHYTGAAWTSLLVMLIVDIPATMALNRDIARRKSRGNPGREFSELAGDEIKESVTEKLLKATGFQDALAEGMVAANSARKESEHPSEFGTGLRAWANVIWTIVLFFGSVYAIIHWW